MRLSAVNVASRPEPDASPNGQTARDQTRPRTGRLPGIRRDPERADCQGSYAAPKWADCQGSHAAPKWADGQRSDAAPNGHGPKAAELLD